MDLEIKKRIEDINNNIVPIGYKKTKLGIIPEDWEVKSLGEVSKTDPKYGINAPAVDYDENLPNYLRITDISNEGRILTEDRKSLSAKNYKDFILKENEIVFARTGNTTGKTYLYNKEDGELVYAGFLIKFEINTEKMLSQLVFYNTRTHRYWNWVSVMSARSGQPGINSKEYASLNLLVPPFKEQEKIVKILSTWDKAIELIENKIEEKTEQKKGLMEKLLTGELRLPGFSDKWKEVRLGDVSKMSSGGTPRSTVPEYYNGNIIWTSISDITFSGKYLCDSERKITQQGLENSSAKIYPLNTILYAMYASIGECSIAKKEVTSSQAILGIIAGDKLDYEFLYYELISRKEKIILQGQQGTQSNLNASMVRNFKLNLPPLEEQKAIGEILSTADREIELLKEKKELYKEQKKGLMQLLLTGIVRV